MKTKTKIFLVVIAVVVVVVFYLLYKKYSPQNIVQGTGTGSETGSASATGTGTGSASASASATGAPQPEFPIFFGSRGEAVKQLQKYLNQYFNAGLTVDGIFGKNTEEAAYQYLGQRSFKSWSEISYLIWIKK